MKERNEIMRFFGLHPQNDVRRRFAFTLAEVLVTLGVIGVVAVLTVPNVISSYQKKVYVTQLQKGYSQLQQVFDLAMADDEVEYLADTELMQSINEHYIGSSDDQSAFISQLGKYMKIQKACNPMDFSDGCHDIQYVDLDGSEETSRGGDLQVFTNNNFIYYFSYFGDFAEKIREEDCIDWKAEGSISCAFHTGGIARSGVLIDVNGSKKPNKYGRDLFVFHVEEKGQLIPMGSTLVAGSSNDYTTTCHLSCNSCSPIYGVGCAAKIMDNGWVMDY